jgi:4-hydroxythreonine-4-phosphate dehydrogenase
MSRDKKINIGLTMGDPAGIGAEVLIKAVAELKPRLGAEYTIIGDRFILEGFCRELKIKGFFDKNCVKLIDLKNVPRRNLKFGKTSAVSAKASIEYLDTAIGLLREGRILALVTAPLNKAAINNSGIKFLGHTEYLASSFGVKNFVMMLINKNLRVVPLTRHIALRQVRQRINSHLISEAVKLVVDYLKRYFALPMPEIAICSLNPHSGEEGFLGEEEKEVILPAIQVLKRNISAKIYGPFSSDGLFARPDRAKFDCIIGMYHDQVLIPIKMFNPQRVVNLTLGLPFIRTSPGHGSALDIAGKGIADHSSMTEAIKLACQLSRNVIP